MPAENQSDSVFESIVTREPPPVTVAAQGTPVVLKASDAVALALDAAGNTSEGNLFLIVNARIKAVANTGQRELRCPFGANEEHGFSELKRPATDESKRKVLERLVEAGYDVTYPDGDLRDRAPLDWAVIRW